MPLDAIRKLNLDYLLLAREMIKEDQLAAIHQLGLNDETVELIKGLSPLELSKIADTNILLCQLRYRDKNLLQLLKDHAAGDEFAQTHALLIGNCEKPEED
jgi:flagellar transcriptional activator FlhD